VVADRHRASRQFSAAIAPLSNVTNVGDQNAFNASWMKNNVSA